MSYACKIVKDSITEAGHRLTTMEVTFPRIVLAEFNTHRMFSRNSASSRAIPVEKMLKRVMEDPFIPIYWGKNQKGMQADVELTETEQADSHDVWLAQRDAAVASAKALMNIGVHKQITNRLLEPFLWHTVIVTATEWGNFFALRCDKDAMPEIRRIAEMMRDTYETQRPAKLLRGEWHLPFVMDTSGLPRLEDANDAKRIGGETGWHDVLVKASCARCARVSYLTHDGRRSIEEDLQLYERLVSSGHMSPLEHAATPLPADTRSMWSGNFRGWLQHRKTIAGEFVFKRKAA